MPSRPAPKRKRPARSRRPLKYVWDAERVKALRDHLGMTQTQFAQELGTQQQTVSEWECGYHIPKGPSVKLLQLIAERAGFVYKTTSSDKE
ncbi:MAG: helix-turn-helix domain-containing protein [Anaerolineales bacterium]|nr:helix-turn-helix domain-containing protein [Anaerolineales bacterium]